MTTFTFKPGDYVVSSLLVGEWEVPQYALPETGYVALIQGDKAVWAPVDSLTRVLPEPPLPPEPPVGAAVYVGGDLWISRPGAPRWFRWKDAKCRHWETIADRATRAVPLADVIKALESDRLDDWSAADAADKINQLFGGAS
jgi:hypothetical protein